VGPVSFLTPLAGLVGLLGLLPIAAFLRRERRARQVRRTLGLVDPTAGSGRSLLVALASIALLGGTAAAQPVIDRASSRPQRTDAELIFAFDTSRSMLAADKPNTPTRFDRARAAALAIREALADVPAGITQFTDWSVPHLFPTIDAATFRFTLERSVFVDSLGSRETDVVGTDLSALRALAGNSYFSPGVSKRVLIVLTDGESRPFQADLTVLPNDGIRTLFVHFWDADESIWRPRGAEPQYRSDPASGRSLGRAAALADGAVFEEGEVGDVVSRARAELGEGPTQRREERNLIALMPYMTLVMLAPLGLLLRSRNL
jgi:hypothetical protein